jgi:hypothetical protein
MSVREAVTQQWLLYVCLSRGRCPVTGLHDKILRVPRITHKVGMPTGCGWTKRPPGNENICKCLRK